jgi:hypothetical protein
MDFAVSVIYYFILYSYVMSKLIIDSDTNDNFMTCSEIATSVSSKLLKKVNWQQLIRTQTALFETST